MNVWTSRGSRARSLPGTLVTALVVGLLLLTAAPAVAAAPVARNSSETTTANQAITLFMRADDADGNALTYTVLTQPGHGTLSGCSYAACTYRPATDYIGPDSFTFRASDGSSTSNTGTVSITVLDPGTPQATPSAEQVTRGRTVVLNVTAFDPQNDPLRFTVTRTTTDGALSGFGPVTCDGAGWCDADISYAATSDTATFDDFDFAARDTGGHASPPATVTIDYLEEEGPVAYSESFDAIADTATALELTGSDDNGDPLTFALVDRPTHGTLTPLSSPDCDGYLCTVSATYTTSGYHGLDQLRFTVSDGTTTSDVATVNLSVVDGPCSGVVVGNGTVKLGVNCKGQLVTGGVGLTRVSTGNDGLRAGCACEGWGVADATSGLSGWANQGKGTSPNTALLSFTSTATSAVSVVDVGQKLRVTHDYHPASASSSAYEVTVTIRNTGATTQDVKYRRVLDFDAEPTSFDEYVTVKAPPGTPVTFDSNDGLVSGDPLAGPSDRGATGSFTDYGPKDQGALFDFSFGTLAPGAAKTFTLYLGASTSQTNALGALSAVGAGTYALAKPSGTNGLAQGSPTTFFFGYGTITATGNAAPTAVDDALAVTQPGSGTVAVLGNDSDADNDPLTVTGNTTPAHGTASCTSGGTCTYLPATGYSGFDSFDYTVSDSRGGTDVGTVSVSVSAAANRAPVAVADTATTLEDTAKVVAVLANDSDPDSDALTITSKTNGSQGSVACTATTCTYTPSANANGTDSFTYTVSDGHGGTAAATVTLTVAPVNDAPSASDDRATTSEDTAVGIDVQANDRDVDGDVLAVVSRTSPTHGGATCTATRCTYAPEADWSGTDTFTYTVADPAGARSTATVTVTVTPVNDPPVADDDRLTTPQDVPGTVDVLDGDTDADGDVLVISGVTDGAHGTVQCALALCTYVPAPGWTGADAFTYTVSDGHGGSAVGRVAVVVGSVNDPPVAHDDAATTDEDRAVQVAVLANDVDADGDTLVVSQRSTAAHGTVTCSTTTCTYTPSADYAGADSFTYTASDGHPVPGTGSATGTATVRITVRPVNDAPVVVDDVATTPARTDVTVPVLANDTDVDGDQLTASLAVPPAVGSATCAARVCTFTPTRRFSGVMTFGYTASDGHGGSATATVSITVLPVTKPGRTTLSRVLPGRRGGPSTATLRWRAPSDGGSTITAYDVLVLQTSRTGRMRRLGVVRVTGDHHRTRVHLDQGRYRFRVAAENAVGRGRWSRRSGGVRPR